MWCKECERETNSAMCELCGSVTEQDIPLVVFWCPDCKAPIIKYANDIAISDCPICKKATSYLCADLRPVFPKERLLLEILQGKPLAYINDSVWASNNRYYINGKPVTITTKFYQKVSPESIREQLNEYQPQNNSVAFDEYIKKFVELNKTRLNYIIDEAYSFINETRSRLSERMCCHIFFRR